MRRAALLIAALAVLAGGCSRVSLAWRFAPWMLTGEAADMLGVADVQRPELRRDVEAYLHGIGRHEAPPLAAWGRSLGHAIEAGRDAEALGLLFDGADRHWDALLEPGVKPAAAWLAREPQARAAALQQAFAERNTRDFKRWPDPQKADADREKRLRSGLKDYLGDLTELQQQAIHDWALRADYPLEGWKADRLRRQEALLARLRGEPEDLQADLEGQLGHWWLDPEKDRDPGYQRDLKAYRARLRVATAQLLASLTPAQRERLGRRLHALADDIGDIGLQAAEKTAK